MKKGAHRQVLEKLFDCLNLCVAAGDYSQHLITAEIKHCSFCKLYTGTGIKSKYRDQVLTKYIFLYVYTLYWGQYFS